MKRTSLLAVAAMMSLSISLGTACHREGPAEEAGEAIDDTVEKMKDKLDPPGPAEGAGRKIDKALGND